MKLNSIFDLSVLTGNKKIQYKNSLGDTIVPVSANITPSFKTVLPDGVTEWAGEQGASFKAWCKKMNIGGTWSRFDKGRGKLVLTKYVRGIV